ncbi:MAG: response regulator transcription factor [Chloroflexota bacterium]
MTVRIVLADDHGILRAGLRNLLNAEPDLEVVGEAADGVEVLEMVEASNPDLILMDISMPHMGGIDVLQHLSAKQPASKVLMLTVHEDESLLKKAIRAGASGYVVKRAAESELITAIRTVMRGDIYIHPAMTRVLLRDLVPVPASKLATDNTLTHRELETLRLVARGHTNNQIAEILCISARTVEGHRANLMDKLGLHSRVELVEYAEHHGLLE